MRFFRSPLLARYLIRKGIWKGSDKNAIYLTFDDGPNPEVTPFVLNVLRKYKIKATFFCVGNNVKNYPEVYGQILEDGHRVGNHTMFHENGIKTSNHAYIESVENASNYIDSDLFRPPYGKVSPTQFKTLIKTLKKKVVFWTWISNDWDKTLASSEIILKAKSIRGGDILVFHDSLKAQKNLTESLEIIIQMLQKRNFHFKNNF
jgi:peptidoglycan/xylan/chitin deacetylase (PgdA/CDA1 family)